MNFRTDQVVRTIMSDTDVVDTDTLRESAIPTVIAFLDDPEISEMTICQQGTAFVPVTYKKISDGPAADVLDGIREVGASLARG